MSVPLVVDECGNQDGRIDIRTRANSSGSNNQSPPSSPSTNTANRTGSTAPGANGSTNA
jgi:hypothetical protein